MRIGRYLSRQQTKFWKSYSLPLQKSRPKKVNALATLKNYLTLNQRNFLLNSVYCPLIWMFTSRYLNNALNNIHERALRLIYNDHEKSFSSIVTENNLKTINKKSLELLAIEICKFQNGLSPPIISDIFFSRQNSYNLRKFQELPPQLKTLWISVWKLFLIEDHNYGT